MMTIEEGRQGETTHLASLAWSIYHGAPRSRRLLMALRPYICPFDEILDHVPDGTSVLDVGCGAGLFLGLLAATGRRCRTLGFDSSPGAIRAARAMAARLQEMGCESAPVFERLDVRAPWPPGPFDVVSVIDVLHHVPIEHRKSLLRRAHDSLRPGGLLIFKDIADRPYWRATANRIHDLVMAREWVRYTPLREIESWAERLGIEVTFKRRINLLWYGHDLCILRRS